MEPKLDGDNDQKFMRSNPMRASDGLLSKVTFVLTNPLSAEIHKLLSMLGLESLCLFIFKRILLTQSAMEDTEQNS